MGKRDENNIKRGSKLELRQETGYEIEVNLMPLELHD
jgi:hypothetical protein